MSKKLSKVVDLFNKQYKRGDFSGGQINIRYQGEVVLNQAVGIARGFNGKCARLSNDSRYCLPCLFLRNYEI